MTYTFEDVKRYYDSIPPGDVDYGYETKDYLEVIYRDVPDGFGCIEVYASPEGPGIASVSISVHPEYRRKGIASEMISRAKFHMKELGIERLEWYCKRSNIASLRTALSNGFEIDQKHCNDEWCTLIWTQKMLRRESGIYE